MVALSALCIQRIRILNKCCNPRLPGSIVVSRCLLIFLRSSARFDGKCCRNTLRPGRNKTCSIQTQYVNEKIDSSVPRSLQQTYSPNASHSTFIQLSSLLLECSIQRHLTTNNCKTHHNEPNCPPIGSRVPCFSMFSMFFHVHHSFSAETLASGLEGLEGKEKELSYSTMPTW